MDTQESFENQQEIDKLRLKNDVLKKELEREQLLHRMVYNDWKKLSEETSAKEYEATHSKPANSFYKYAFYTLFISLIPLFYFLYHSRENDQASSSLQTAPASTLKTDSITTSASAPAKDTIVKSEAAPLVKEKLIDNPDSIRPPALEPPPVTKARETKVVRPDTSKRAMVIVDKPAFKTTLTNDARDSIYWVGWNAYFSKSRNPFRKSSEDYKIWLEGWNDGRTQTKKVVAKDLSRPQK